MTITGPSNENRLREDMARLGAVLYTRGLAHGSAGNLSVRLPDGFLVTPTNSCLGRLDPADISKITPDGRHVSGAPPSKEAFLHQAMYDERPNDGAIVHLHSTHSVALSCLGKGEGEESLPPITAYYVMKVGSLPRLPYFRPGDRALAEAVRAAARKHQAVLLSNHGPVLADATLEAAVYGMEELEETARLFFLLRGEDARYLSPEKVAALARPLV